MSPQFYYVVAIRGEDLDAVSHKNDVFRNISVVGYNHWDFLELELDSVRSMLPCSFGIGLEE